MGNEELVQFVESLSGESHLRVQDDLGGGFVRLRAAEAQRRQAQQDIQCVEDVVLELLRNARDAHCKSIFVASWKEGSTRRLTVIDDGDGIPASHQDLVFEPFVTSKLDTFHSDRWGVHGRGMALYSIKQNVDDVHIAKSKPGLGSSFVVGINTEELPEKRDQSSLPSVVVDETGERLLRGPHNIARTVLEFAIDERENIAVYLGSPTEISARLYAMGSTVVSRTNAVFDHGSDSVPLIMSFAYSLDPETFAKTAGELGLPMSDRSARRILDGDIAPAETLLSQFASAQNEEPDTSRSKSRENPDGGSLTKLKDSFSRLQTAKLIFTEEDLRAFRTSLQSAFENLAESYYLDPKVEISMKRDRGSLRIDIPLVPKD